MTVGCPTGADVKTPVFGPSEGMTGMAEAIFGLSGVTIVAVAAVGPITEVTGADPIVALDPTKVVIGVDPMDALDPKGMLIGVVCPTEPPNPAETFTTGVSELLPFPAWISAKWEALMNFLMNPLQGRSTLQSADILVFRTGTTHHFPAAPIRTGPPMASEERFSATERRPKVVVVGAGGIGCELLKTLALSGFQDIHIIDMDTIEVSNLNRQFLFRRHHVGQSKARVARDAILKFRPGIQVTAYHASVLDTDFNVDFFKQFNVVLNGLDNLVGRRHVNRLCLAAGVPLVDSGTTGFLGQVTVHVKGKTECYECQPKPAPKVYPVCTITNTPSKFVHCIVWAKEMLFAKLFGDINQENDLNVPSNDDCSSSANTHNIFEFRLNEDIEQYGRRIYDHVFGYNIEVALSNEDMWKNRNKPRPTYIKDILPFEEIQQSKNGDKASKDDQPSSVSAMASLGLKNPQEVWSLKENTKLFLESLKLFFSKRPKDIGNLIFDKDDQLALEFEIFCRMTYCLEHPSRKLLLVPFEPSEPSKSCYVCSGARMTLEVNTKGSRLKDFLDRIVKAKLGMHFPLIMHGAALLYEEGDDLEDDMVANYIENLDKVLCELPSPITGGTIITVEDFLQELTCMINIKQREEFDDEEEPDGMVLYGWTPESTNKEVHGNAASPSKVSQTATQDIDKDDSLAHICNLALPSLDIFELPSRSE
ncbi:unnamed protein product [Cuscuta campestris]|uniref:SUMO-activating enzyme subunit n=1 Tax=Cuscuta campestris TaxID=132261 RepID=A0A484L7A9_9ASTE|nr:unnamed protein product [Cuscuta campestris]